MGPSSVEEEGMWLMGAVWYFGAWRAKLQGAQAELKTIALALHAACMGLPTGERWFGDLQQRCANRGPVLDRPAFFWPSLEERPWWKTQEEGKLYKYGWQAWHLTALERRSHEAKLKDQYYSPCNPKVGKLAKPSLGNRLQARERKSIKN